MIEIQKPPLILILLTEDGICDAIRKNSVSFSSTRRDDFEKSADQSRRCGRRIEREIEKGCRRFIVSRSTWSKKNTSVQRSARLACGSNIIHLPGKVGKYRIWKERMPKKEAENGRMRTARRVIHRNGLILKTFAGSSLAFAFPVFCGGY